MFLINQIPSKASEDMFSMFCQQAKAKILHFLRYNGFRIDDTILHVSQNSHPGILVCSYLFNFSLFYESRGFWAQHWNILIIMPCPYSRKQLLNSDIDKLNILLWF